MTTKVRAWYANGVLTPLEPLDLEEGTEVVLSLDMKPARDIHSALSEIREELERIYQLPDDDPKKYKLLLDTEDVQIYLEKELRLRGRLG